MFTLMCFFSGMEIAFISSNKIYLELEKKQYGFLSKILTKLTEKPSKFHSNNAYWKQYCFGSLRFFYGRFVDELDKIVPFHFLIFEFIVANSYFYTYSSNNC
jgi:putative hemolysin